MQETNEGEEEMDGSGDEIANGIKNESKIQLGQTPKLNAVHES